MNMFQTKLRGNFHKAAVLKSQKSVGWKSIA